MPAGCAIYLQIYVRFYIIYIQFLFNFAPSTSLYCLRGVWRMPSVFLPCICQIFAYILRWVLLLREIAHTPRFVFHPADTVASSNRPHFWSASSAANQFGLHICIISIGDPVCLSLSQPVTWSICAWRAHKTIAPRDSGHHPLSVLLCFLVQEICVAQMWPGVWSGQGAVTLSGKSQMAK